MEVFEQQKVDLIKTILKEYMENDSMNKDKYESLMNVLEKSTESSYIKMFYSPEDLIEKDLLREVCMVEGMFEKQQIDISHLKNFL